MKIHYKNSLHPGQETIWGALMLQTTGKPFYKKVVVNTGRQVGKTTLAKRWALNRVVNEPGCEIGWITPETAHFTKVFQWFTTNLKDIITRHDSQKNIIYFSNGSVLYFFSVENHIAIRGNAFDYRIMDEYSFGRFGQEEAVKSLSGTLIAKGKQELILSTPRGKNHHYYAYHRAKEHARQFAYQMKTEDNPSHDPEELAEEKRIKPKDTFEQEYEGKFIDSGGEVFKEISKVSVINRLPNITGGPVVTGIDWGLVNDHTAVALMDLDGTVVDTFTSYQKHYPTIVAEIAKFLSKYDVINGYAETNGVGLPNFQMLRDKVPCIRPWTMTQNSKADIVNHLNHAIQNEEVKLPNDRAHFQMNFQLGDYTFKYSANGKLSYTHPPGGKDDWVDALTMCYQCVLDENNTIKTRSISRRRDNKPKWSGVTRTTPGKYK